jgi:uncharacterized protein (TIGR00730 family)
MKSICVFCGSSPGDSPDFLAAAKEMGRELAARGMRLVYGGGNVGLMGAVADSALEHGAEVIGVIPRSLMQKELGHTRLTELRVVASMHERKNTMADLSEAFVAMPGGFGTFEEFCEVVTWTQLGLHHKPCGLLNIAGFYAPLLEMFDRAVAHRFIRPEQRALVLVDSTPGALLDRLSTAPVPIMDKWLDRAST